MKLIKFQTDNFNCWTAKVDEVVIGNETIPIYEISVNIKENKIEVIFPYGAQFEIDFAASKYENEFFDAFQKLFNEVQKEETVFFAFIYSYINRYCFYVVSFEGDDNPVKGFLQAWFYGPDGGNWLTLMESPAVADKREKDEIFRRALEKWTLAKFLQLVLGDKSLPFALPHYGTKDTVKTIRQYFGEKGFGNGIIHLGKMTVHNYWSKVTGHHHNLYAIWDKETGWRKEKLTEEDFELLHNDLTENR